MPIRVVATPAWPNRRRAGPPASLSDRANVIVSPKAYMPQFSLPSPISVFSMASKTAQNSGIIALAWIPTNVVY